LWLDTKNEEVEELFAPIPSSEIVVRPVNFS
jgi:hypothetical protein